MSVMGRIAHVPAAIPAQNVLTPAPKGLTAPRPLTTTALRLPGRPRHSEGKRRLASAPAPSQHELLTGAGARQRQRDQRSARERFADKIGGTRDAPPKPPWIGGTRDAPPKPPSRKALG